MSLHFLQIETGAPTPRQLEAVGAAPPAQTAHPQAEMVAVGAIPRPQEETQAAKPVGTARQRAAVVVTPVEKQRSHFRHRAHTAGWGKLSK